MANKNLIRLTFPNITIKTNDTLTTVFTLNEKGLWVHGELRNADGKVVYKSKKEPLVGFTIITTKPANKNT